MIEFVKTTALFALTALAEIVGCYLPWLVIKQGRPAWLLLPAALSLGIFAWLLTLHPSAAGRTYAAYGGMYIAAALIWLWRGGRHRPHALGSDRRGGGARRHGHHCPAT